MIDFQSVKDKAHCEKNFSTHLNNYFNNMVSKKFPLTNSAFLGVILIEIV